MDDGHIWGELLIIILLVLANGACSLAEIAIVGARKTKLQEMIDAGSKNAVYALRLAEKKEELFSTIQVGITTISIITGMFRARRWRVLWGASWRKSRSLPRMRRASAWSPSWCL